MRHLVLVSAVLGTVASNLSVPPGATLAAAAATPSPASALRGADLGPEVGPRVGRAVSPDVGPTPASVRHRRVVGTIERVSLEAHALTPSGSGGPEAAVATWVRSGSRRTQVPTSELDHLEVGTTVRLDVAAGSEDAAAPDAPAAPPATAPAPESVAESGSDVLSVQVVEGPQQTAAAATSRHEVTAVMVVPRGGRRDGTRLSSLTAAIDGPVSRFWSSQTGGRVRFRVTKAVGWISLTSSCTQAWQLWSEAARRSGFVPGPRRHLVVFVPSGQRGCFSGLGTIGRDVDAGGYSYVRGTLTGLIAHELGHNMGLGHSNGLQCDGRPDGTYSDGWPSRCTASDYRDWYDVMGVSWNRLGSLSMAHARRLGLLEPGALRTVTAPTQVRLAPVSGRTGLRALRIAGPGAARYIVEYRPAAGRDSWLAGNARGLVDGVLVRRTDPQDPSQTLLLDATPSPRSSFDVDWRQPIPPGSTLTAASRRVAVRVDGVTPEGATVSVAIDGVWPQDPLDAASGVTTRLGARGDASSTGTVSRTPAAEATSAPARRYASPVVTPAR